jgi:hypothetical protein
MRLYAVTIFLGAFLLFEVEPIVAKIILPWFGGSAAVWSTCLLFFQLVLLLGYLYAHGLVRLLRPKMQAALHITLLGVSFIVLPILPGDSWKPFGPEDPALHILLLLVATIGLPYFLLSATSPLLQAWHAVEHPGAAPYRLFALSNAGSMLALLSYPVLVEPFFSTRHQAKGWSVAYTSLVLLCGIVALRLGRKAVHSGDPGRTPPDEDRALNVSYRRPRPPWSLHLLWASLAACVSALLLAVTNHLSQNVAAVPFLWVLPLSLYLLSFILCFEGRKWYRRDLFLRSLAVALGSMAYALSPDFANSSLRLLIPLYSAGLFICCMVCHGELERLKPHPRHLTSFYLMVALGGAIGGLFVGLLAPHIFSGYFELHVAIASCGWLTLVALRRDPAFTLHDGRWKPIWLLLIGLCALLTLSLSLQIREEMNEARVMVRNFYGSLRVTETDPDLEHQRRRLTNGTIQHGSQFLEAHRRRLPTTYYGPNSGAGIALSEAGKRGSIRVGVIGLGVGTLAAYGRQGDHYTFYDINPLVIKLATGWFTFLRDSSARVDIVLGDARLSLARQPPQHFDVLAVDAFTSDSIPVHLLTRQALLLYLMHLKSDGILAVHISNRYLDLEPVVRGVAGSLGKTAVAIESKRDDDNGVFVATWVLVTDNQVFLQSHDVQMAITPTGVTSKPQVWTDDYSNLFRILK